MTYRPSSGAQRLAPPADQQGGLLREEGRGGGGQADQSAPAGLPDVRGCAPQHSGSGST